MPRKRAPAAPLPRGLTTETQPGILPEWTVSHMIGDHRGGAIPSGSWSWCEVRIVLKSKIHRAKVTDTDLDYEGSIGIDARLMREADLLPYEQVHVLNVSNGARF